MPVRLGPPVNALRRSGDFWREIHPPPVISRSSTVPRAASGCDAAWSQLMQCLVVGWIPAGKPTFQSESQKAPELSAQPQLAVRQAGRFFCDHMRLFSEGDDTRVERLRSTSWRWSQRIPADAMPQTSSKQTVSKARRAASLPLRRLVPPARFRYSTKTSGQSGGGVPLRVWRYAVQLHPTAQNMASSLQSGP